MPNSEARPAPLPLGLRLEPAPPPGLIEARYVVDGADVVDARYIALGISRPGALVKAIEIRIVGLYVDEVAQQTILDAIRSAMAAQAERQVVPPRRHLRVEP